MLYAFCLSSSSFFWSIFACTWKILYIKCVWWVFSTLTELCTLLSSSNDASCSCEQFGITSVENDEVIAKLWAILKCCILIAMVTDINKERQLLRPYDTWTSRTQQMNNTSAGVVLYRGSPLPMYRRIIGWNSIWQIEGFVSADRSVQPRRRHYHDISCNPWIISDKLLYYR